MKKYTDIKLKNKVDVPFCIFVITILTIGLIFSSGGN